MEAHEENQRLYRLSYKHLETQLISLLTSTIISFRLNYKSFKLLGIDQKERFIGLNKGPESRDDVLHLYNFKNIRDNAEKPFLVQAVLNGAEQPGSTDGILFLNYE